MLVSTEMAPVAFPAKSAALLPTPRALLAATTLKMIQLPANATRAITVMGCFVQRVRRAAYGQRKRRFANLALILTIPRAVAIWASQATGSPALNVLLGMATVTLNVSYR